MSRSRRVKKVQERAPSAAAAGDEPSPAPAGSTSAAAPAATLTRREWTEKELRTLSARMLSVARRTKVLPSLAWPMSVKRRFLAAEGRELPQVEYADRREEFAAVEARARDAASLHPDDDPVDTWARATFESQALAARMLAAIGTPEFTRASRELYGGARTPFLDGETTGLDLARHLLQTVNALGFSDPEDGDDQLDARSAARNLKERLRIEFPGEEIKVLLSPNLAAKAIAGPRKIRLRKSAHYTRHEIEVLVVHEGLVHMATTLNGLHQPLLRCLSRGSPRTMRVQEGLAVFAEFMAGVVNLRRLRRLADRVAAIDMAERGADFLEVYRYYLERGRFPGEAYESARRVFRGGDVRGGACFTKDVVYLHGAAQVRNFLEVGLTQGDLSDVPRLFVGKLDLDDLQAIRDLSAAGWLAPPRYLPTWARDTGLLAASLSFGAFFRRIDLDPLREHYAPLYEG